MHADDAATAGRDAEPLSRVRRHLLRAGAAALALVPLLLALTPAVVALALGRIQPM
jgi:hypothetical protein